MNSSDYYKVFLAISYRDLRFIVKKLPSRLFDSAILATMQVLGLGYFLPLLGLPQEAIGPLFIGTATNIIYSLSYNISFSYVLDLERNRYINYAIILPIPTALLFAQFVFIFLVEVMIITFPLFFLASSFLSPAFSWANANIGAVALMFFIYCLFSALLFIYLAFATPYTWFLDNIWPRRLAPLALLGCGAFTWKKVYLINSLLGSLLLLNPLTYIHEGLRSAFFGGNDYLPYSLALVMAVFWCIIIFLLLLRAIKQRLDPV